MELVNPLDRGAVLIVDSPELVDDRNPTNDEHLALFLHLSRDPTDECSVACVDTTRLQRAPECPGQSAAGGGDDIVDRRRVRWILVGVDAVVVRHCTVHAERDWRVSSR